MSRSISRRSWQDLWRPIVAAALVAGGCGLCGAAKAAEAVAAVADTGMVENIVVESSRDRSLAAREQDAPKPVSVVSGDLLSDIHIDTVMELPNILPSTDFHAYNANNVVLQVRGLGAASVSGGQWGQVGVYVDGMYQGRQNALAYSLHDLDTVELVPGPQGTTNGALGIAGDLVINSAKPSFTPGAIASATIGDWTNYRTSDWGRRQVWGAATGPVAGDVDAIRLTAYSDTVDGWATNVLANQSVNDAVSRGVRFQNLYRHDDDFTLLLLASYDNLGQHSGQPLWNGNVQSATNHTTFQQVLNSVSSKLTIPGYVIPTNPDETDINHNQNFEGHTARVSANANWDITSHLLLTSISAWQNYKIWPNNDGDWTALDIQRQSGSHNWSVQRSEELRLASHDNDLVDWVAGYFYFHQRTNQISDTQYGPDYAAITKWNKNYGPQSLWTPANVTNIAYEAQAWNEQENDSLYGQATVKLAPEWDVVAGLRETWDHQNVVANTRYANPGFGNFTAAEAASIFNTPLIYSQGGAVRSANLGGTFGVDYRPDRDVLLYSSINRGYLPAGTQTGVLAQAALNAGGFYGIAEEKIIDGEFGAKTKWLDDKVTANLTYYKGAVFNYQQTISVYDPVTNSYPSFLANVKAVAIQGFELNGTVKPLSWLQLGTASSYNLTQYRSFDDSPCPPEINAKVCNLSGKRVYGAPHWIANLWGEVTLPAPLGEDSEAYLRTEYNHQSGSFLQANNTNQSWQGAWGNANAQLGVRLNDRAIDLSLWIKNIFNVQYMTYQTTANNVNWAIFSDPRAAGATITARF